MKLVCLLGSPRRLGNSATIASGLVSRAKELGADAEIIYLNGLAFQGCQACYGCKLGAEQCVLNDDLAIVLKKVSEADALVMATPVYYGDVTGQLKLFIDRTFSFLVPDYASNPVKSRLAPGKRLAMVISQGHPDDQLFADVFPRYSNFFKWLGYSEARLVRGCGLSEKSNPIKREDLMAEAERVAEWLVKG